MGFTSKDSGGGDMEAMNNGADHQMSRGPNFGQRVMQYAEHRYPVAGGLLDQVFGQNQTQAQNLQMAPMPTDAPEHEDMLGMNAMPRKSQSGGLSTLLKLLA